MEMQDMKNPGDYSLEVHVQNESGVELVKRLEDASLDEVSSAVVLLREKIKRLKKDLEVLVALEKRAGQGERPDDTKIRDALQLSESESDSVSEKQRWLAFRKVEGNAPHSNA